jgi:hypothetical protein
MGRQTVPGPTVIEDCIVLSERHLHRIVSDYVAYYHASRTHLGLKKDTPNRREVEPPQLGPVRSRKVLGGLHHRYFRRVG